MKMNSITREQKEKFLKHHIPEEPMEENKSLMDMSLDELDKSWKQYKRLVEIDEMEKEQ